MSNLDCCEDYERTAGLNRRRFLRNVAGATGAVAATTMFGDAVRQASFGAVGGNTLVVVSLRGGMDGLGMVVPHGDPAYYTARPRLGVPRGSLLAQDSYFGLHPAMAPLKWAWDAGEMAAVHAVGMAMPNRSHFAAIEQVEDADPGSSVRTGWVNRMIGLADSRQATDAVHLGNSMSPTLVTGPADSLAAESMSELELTGTSNGWGARRRAGLRRVWSDDSGPLGEAARTALKTVDVITPISKAAYRAAVVYPTSYPASDLSAALKDTARLIKADIGTEVVSVDFGSWDMHANYGNTDSGSMQRMLSALAQSLSAFLRDLGDLRSRVTVVTISEFGRRVTENGNRGLDHGWGNAMLLLGAGVRPGYHGTWPGLGAGKLVQGDLAVTTDYRQVLGEVVHTRFPDRAVSTVFPGLVYNPLGVMR